MSKQQVLLLYGGRSEEHEISLRSAAFVSANIDDVYFDQVAVGIAKSGIWYLQPPNIKPAGGIMPLEEDPSRIVSLVPGVGLKGPGEVFRHPVVFPVLHGSFGEDGTLQGALETALLPYVGAGVLGCSLSMDKGMIKKVWRDEGLRVVPFKVLRRSQWKQPDFSISRFLEKELGPLAFPFFVKPANTGSSLGISRVDKPGEVTAALEMAFRYDSKILVEPYIEARELECSVIGNGPMESFVVGEVSTDSDFYDYKAKYVDTRGTRLLVPAPIDRSLEREIRNIAERACLSAGVHGFARVDFFLNERDGRIYLNELNAIPGFTEISLFPRLCREGGLSPKKLIRRLINLGLEKYKEKKRLFS